MQIYAILIYGIPLKSSLLEMVRRQVFDGAFLGENPKLGNGLKLTKKALLLVHDLDFPLFSSHLSDFFA